MDSKERSHSVKTSKQTKDDDISTNLENLEVLRISTTAVAESKSNGGRNDVKPSKASVCEEKKRILEEEADDEFAALMKAPNSGTYQRAFDPVAQAICAGFRM